MQKLSVVAVIPSRYGAQRFPAKPLVDLLGKPMIQHVYERVCRAQLVGSVIVATDDERIAAPIRSIGGTVRMTDPALPSGTDRIAAALDGIDADIVVNVQGDEPLIHPGMIDESISGLLERPEAGAATPAKEISDPEDLINPNVVKVVCASDGRALYFSRSPIPFVRNAPDRGAWINGTKFLRHFGLYVYRRSVLDWFTTREPGPLERAEQLEQLRMLENGIQITIVRTNFDSIPVDTPEDAERVRDILKSHTT